MAINAIRIKQAAKAIDEVDSIDKLIEWLGKDVEKSATEWGDDVIDALGRNRMARIGRERAGLVVFCAIVNDLLREREMIVADHCDVVEFIDPPCPKQIFDQGI